MASTDEAACASCYSAALEAAADRLSDRYEALGYRAYSALTDELATNLVATGQITCASHRLAIAQAAS